VLRRASSLGGFRRSLLAVLLASLALGVPAAAGTVGARASASGHDGDAIVVISGDVTVARGEIVDGVYIASGDARIAGRVTGDVVVFSGDVVVSGTIEGDLFTASGVARLLPSAEVGGDVNYADEHPVVSNAARVHGDVSKQSFPDLGGVAILSGIIFWLAVSFSMAVLGLLLLLLAPRAAEAIQARSRERAGPTIAIGIAIAIAVSVGAVIAAVTILALPLAFVVLLALLPLAAAAYVTTAWALGRRVMRPPRNRYLAFLAGIAILRAAALVPIVGAFVGLAAVVFGLGLIGAAIGAARTGADPSPAETPGS
jgi:cytoskeletal protein CcmA (bactofilin family)